MAEELGMSQGAVSLYERGQRVPRQQQVIEIALALAGPSATPEEIEALRRAALAASVGLSGEIERITDMEYARGRYTGELSAIREIEQHPDLKEVLDGTMEMLLRQAQKRSAIGGGAGERKDEEKK